MTALPLVPFLTGFLFIGVRLTGVMLFAPFFGSSAIPPRVKAGLVLALSALLYPVVGARVAPIPALAVSYTIRQG